MGPACGWALRGDLPLVAAALLLLPAACARSGFEAYSDPPGRLGDGDTRVPGDGAFGDPSTGDPGRLALSPTAPHMNVNSWLTFAASGGAPPYVFSIASTDDPTGQSRIDPVSGSFRSGGVDSTATVLVTDDLGAQATAEVSVAGTELFVLGGVDWTTGATIPSVYATTDGASWALAGELPSGREDGNVVVYADRIWYLGGFDGTSTRANVWSSPDGVTWDEVGDLPSARDIGALVVFDGKLVYLGGTTSDSAAGALNEILVSSDGINWQTLGSLPVAVLEHGAVVFDGRIWIAGGRSSAGVEQTAVYSSVDGTVWTSRDALIRPSAGFGFAAMGATFFSFGGYPYGSTPTAVGSSTGGGVWSKVGDLPRGYSQGAFPFFAGKLWIIGGHPQGMAQQGSTDVLASADGETWSAATPFPCAIVWNEAVAFTRP